MPCRAAFKQTKLWNTCTIVADISPFVCIIYDPNNMLSWHAMLTTEWLMWTESLCNCYGKYGTNLHCIQSHDSGRSFEKCYLQDLVNGVERIFVDVTMNFMTKHHTVCLISSSHRKHFCGTLEKWAWPHCGDTPTRCTSYQTTARKQGYYTVK